MIAPTLQAGKRGLKQSILKLVQNSTLWFLFIQFTVTIINVSVLSSINKNVHCVDTFVFIGQKLDQSKTPVIDLLTFYSSALRLYKRRHLLVITRDFRCCAKNCRVYQMLKKDKRSSITIRSYSHHLNEPVIRSQKDFDCGKNRMLFCLFQQA